LLNNHLKFEICNINENILLQSIKDSMKRNDFDSHLKGNSNDRFELMDDYLNQCLLQFKAKQWDSNLNENESRGF
jgi:hypothetical protein